MLTIALAKCFDPAACKQECSLVPIVVLQTRWTSGGRGTSFHVLHVMKAHANAHHSSGISPGTPHTELYSRACDPSFYTVVSPHRLLAACRCRIYLTNLYP